MTTHGRGGLGRLIFGSVADAVLRNSPVPVLLVRVKA
jgi:nucleotide-binding universal stress UspA family protein